MPDTRTDAVSRRTFVKGVGAATGGLWLARHGVAWGSAEKVDLDPAPFEYGVASGDPLPGGVTLWTRVGDGSRSLTYRVWRDKRGKAAPASDRPHLGAVVAEGTVAVDPTSDGTVSMHVPLPEPGRFYWYQFATPDGALSVLGRTKTATTESDGVRFAVASCQDFQNGYYSAWKHVAEQDLDFVLFLGDYIYEYPDDGDDFRPHVPVREILTLGDYRDRYRNYRSDAMLREAHRLHPFIVVWDDHEVADNRWGRSPAGSDNHSAAEGDFGARKTQAERAFFEWLPIQRPEPSSEPSRIYRAFSFGNLAEILMLDTRSYNDKAEGRLFSPAQNANKATMNPSRTLLGVDQKTWLKDRLATSTAAWKIVGSPVMFAPLGIGHLPEEYATALAGATAGIPGPFQYPRDGIALNHDQWDNFQVERRELLEWIAGADGRKKIENVAFYSGDIHASFASELSVHPGDAGVAGAAGDALHAGAQDPVTVEFTGPSVSSANVNEIFTTVLSAIAGKKLPDLPHGAGTPLARMIQAGNPQMRYADVDNHGYLLVDVSPKRLVTEYYFATTAGLGNPVQDPQATMTRAATFQVASGTARITRPPHG